MYRPMCIITFAILGDHVNKKNREKLNQDYETHRAFNDGMVFCNFFLPFMI